MRDRIFALMIVIAMPLAAQPPQGGRGGPPQSPQTMAPIDLTGYWVSVVNEDWRFRMVMPPPGDYQGVPMTPAAVKVADAWDPAKDEAAGDQCKAYGAPALLRVPEHLHFSWQDDRTLRMDTDAGTQTRLFHFGDWKAPARSFFSMTRMKAWCSRRHVRFTMFQYLRLCRRWRHLRKWRRSRIHIPFIVP